MGTCGSCGRDGEATVTVRRVYLVPTAADPGDPTSPDERAEPVIVDGDEEWCASCRDHFPHVVVGT